MDDKINQRFKAIEKRLDVLEGKNKKLGEELEQNLFYNFENKKSNHNKLLEELLKSDFCHSKRGLTQKEILEVFDKNNRPVVPKKIRDLLHTWKKRKKIEAIKLKGDKQNRYFWIENEKPNKSN